MQSNVQVDVANTIDTEGFGRGLEALADALGLQTNEAINLQANIAALETATDVAIYNELKEGFKNVGVWVILGGTLYFTRKYWSKYL